MKKTKNPFYKKILDTNVKEFYDYENTSKLSLDDLKSILQKSKDTYNKALKYATDNKLPHTFIPNERQWLALKELDLKNFKKSRVALGGGVAGSKTALGAYWVISNALNYPKTAYGVGRNMLSVMDTTTIPSFFEMLEILKVPKTMFKYNSQKHILKFNNGSVIYFVELRYKPEDRDYSRIRGLQLTAAFIDEANEINEQGVLHLATRTGRMKNEEYKLKGKTLFTFNPSKGFVYRTFYQPWKKNLMPDDTVYLPSLAINNPFISEDYIEDLWKLPPNVKQTQLLGNFDFDDSDDAIVTYQDIQNVWTNVIENVEHRYMSVDISGIKGADNTVFSIWRGWELFHIQVEQNLPPDAIIENIRTLAEEYKVPMKHVVIDAIGIGESIAYSNKLAGCFPFKSSNSPMITDKDAVTKVNKYDEIELHYKKKIPKYINLRSQVAWVLAGRMKEGGVGIRVGSEVQIKVGGELKNLKEVITEELSLLRDKNFGMEEKKRQLIPKNEMKEYINRSPDILDVILMRGVFDLISQYDIISERKVTPLAERKFFKKRQTKRITYS